MRAKFYNIGSYDNPVYLIGSTGSWTLIEGGISAQLIAVKRRLESVVSNYKDIKRWIILHTHYDHCGLLSYLHTSLPSVQIWAGEKAIGKLNKDKSIHVIESLNNDVIQLRSSGKAFENITKISLNTIKVNQLNDYQVIVCAKDIRFTVIPSPGHSDCSISLYEQYSGRLFVSDALGEYFTPKEWFPLAFSSISDYLKSIEILKTTEAKTIALGHGECLEGKAAKEAFHDSILSTHKIIEKVQNKLKTETKENIAKTLHKQYAYNSQGFVPDYLHCLSMERLVKYIEIY